jgi:hypothetical protein
MAPYPHPRVFFAKSAESLEKKRVEFCASAKNCKRVRKSVKKKGIARKHVATLEASKVGSLGRGTPHYMHEFENKRVAKWAPRKCMKRKRLIFVGLAWGETQNGNGSREESGMSERLKVCTLER